VNALGTGSVTTVDRLLVGAPGGPKKVGAATDIVNGRLHVLSAPTFQ
jgi:hypothetical protein